MYGYGMSAFGGGRESGVALLIRINSIERQMT